METSSIAFGIAALFCVWGALTYYLTKVACIHAIREFEVRERPKFTTINRYLDPGGPKYRCEVGDEAITENFDFGLVCAVDDQGFPTKVMAQPTKAHGAVYYQDAEKIGWYPTGEKCTEEEWLAGFDTYLDKRRKVLDQGRNMQA